MKINFFKKSKFIPIPTFDYCLSKEESKKLMELDIDKLMDIDSEKRINIFSKFLGVKKAKWFNEHFEKDIILKRQKEALLSWINKEKDVKPKYREEIIRKISSLEKSLNSKELESFIEELAEIKLGIRLTIDETKKIFELSEMVSEAKRRMDIGSNKADYEKALKDYEDYIEELKNPSDL